MLKKYTFFITMLFLTSSAMAQATFQYDAAGNRVKRLGGPDLTPRITVNPGLFRGVTNVEIILAVVNVSKESPTNGTEITVLVAKNPYMSGLIYNAAATNATGGSVQNTIWTPSENDSYYLFKTTAVIPASSQRRLVYNITFNPLNASTLAFSLGATIPAGGSGGERNLLNNQDAAAIEFSK